MSETRLVYLEGPEAEEDKFWSSGYGSTRLFEKAFVRVYVEERRVETPFSFSVQVDLPKGKRGLYPVKASAIADDALWEFGEALEQERKQGREVHIMHNVDGEEAVYWAKRIYASYGNLTFSCEFLSGRPMIFKRANLVS